jgi:hypothetical protein
VPLQAAGLPFHPCTRPGNPVSRGTLVALGGILGVPGRIFAAMTRDMRSWPPPRSPAWPPPSAPRSSSTSAPRDPGGPASAGRYPPFQRGPGRRGGRVGRSDPQLTAEFPGTAGPFGQPAAADAGRDPVPLSVTWMTRIPAFTSATSTSLAAACWPRWTAPRAAWPEPARLPPRRSGLRAMQRWPWGQTHKQADAPAPLRLAWAAPRRLAPGSATWAKTQAIKVPTQYGSSSWLDQRPAPRRGPRSRLRGCHGAGQVAHRP